MKKLSFLTKFLFKIGVLTYLFDRAIFYRDNELSEDFIKQYQDYMDWYYVSAFQKLSEEFIIEFENKINFIQLLRNKNLPSYSKEFQRFLLKKLMNKDHFSENVWYYKKYFTNYMEEHYEKLSIML